MIYNGYLWGILSGLVGIIYFAYDMELLGYLMGANAIVLSALQQWRP